MKTIQKIISKLYFRYCFPKTNCVISTVRRDGIIYQTGIKEQDCNFDKDKYLKGINALFKNTINTVFHLEKFN